MQNEPNWGPGAPDCGLMIADCGLEDAACGRAPEAKCAKRTQFGGRIVRNEPNLAWPEAECAKRTQFGRPAGPRLRIVDCGLRIGRCRAGMPDPRRVQNEANFGQSVGVPRGVVQNKANSRAAGIWLKYSDNKRLREEQADYAPAGTKPISSGVPAESRRRWCTSARW
jgi:hypothetical protein